MSDKTREEMRIKQGIGKLKLRDFFLVAVTGRYTHVLSNEKKNLDKRLAKVAVENTDLFRILVRALGLATIEREKILKEMIDKTRKGEPPEA